jgi:Tfp pilus assembly protein PilO
VSLTDRDRKIMIALVPVVLLVAYWFLLLAPKRTEASTASLELTTQQQRLDDARAQLKAAQGAKQTFDASYAQVVRLGKAIPSTVDMPSLLVQLDAAAAGTGIRFTKIATGDRVQSAAPATPAPATATPPAGSESGTTGAPVAAGGETAQSAPGGAAEAANNAQQTANQAGAAPAGQSGVAPSDAQTSTSNGGGLPVGGGTATATGDTTTAAAPAGLETVPLELEFVGNFFNLADFFHSVKRFVSLTNDNVVVSGRLLTVENVRWASEDEIFPRLRAEIKATIYLSPKAQGVTAGATSQGPTTGTPASATTPAPASGTPAPAPAPAPTATATP